MFLSDQPSPSSLLDEVRGGARQPEHPAASPTCRSATKNAIVVVTDIFIFCPVEYGAWDHFPRRLTGQAPLSFADQSPKSTLDCWTIGRINTIRQMATSVHSSEGTAPNP